MNTNRRTFGGWLLVIIGSLLSILGVRMAMWFCTFPGIPGLGFLNITYWRDTVAFAVIATLGAALIVWGIVRLNRRPGKSC